MINFPTVGTVCVLPSDLKNFSLVPQEVDEFKYLGLTLDRAFTMDAATSAGVKQIQFAHAKLAATLHSLRQLPRRQTHSALSPTMRLQMWKGPPMWGHNPWGGCHNPSAQRMGTGHWKTCNDVGQRLVR